MPYSRLRIFIKMYACTSYISYYFLNPLLLYEKCILNELSMYKGFYLQNLFNIIIVLFLAYQQT